MAKTVPRVCAVIPARNAERTIKFTLASLRAQKSVEVIPVVIDDSSRDATGSLAKSMGAYVIRVERSRLSATGTPILASLINKGIRFCLARGADFVFICGSDDVFPPNFIARLVEQAERDELAVTSGRVVGEPWREDMPRGGGRLIDASFLKRWGGYLPVFGWEAELVYRAFMLGFKASTVSQAVFYSLKPAYRNPLKFFLLGISMYCLGYLPPYAIVRSLLTLLRAPRLGAFMLIGYLKSLLAKAKPRCVLTPNQSLRELHLKVLREVRVYVRRRQALHILNLLSLPWKVCRKGTSWF